MDYQKPQIKTESIRLRIKADVPADYFHQPMAIARGPDGVVYLRIGDDIYEGRAVLENTDGTAVHFDVAVMKPKELPLPVVWQISLSVISSISFATWPNVQSHTKRDRRGSSENGDGHRISRSELY
ncbi:uncharacterized protein LOC129587737 isoform X1 [Paramacrobiotus metropolitanus]|uniref:uncharacterized protein LOC129587737 isoform X1 n=1 Tax=Paramacrobiotus metropolitanus TaxID=2943436 RepID=UPI002445BD57|nr:uncharacterized protein LOC129587737 isoform X1 [Paramacrobiotus metropolitanus]